MAELGNPHNCVTLDTKILAQLSKVAKGELARQILTFKDTEAQSKRVVRGRHVLLMFEQYFKTKEEAGALYGTEDFLQVGLHSDDLKSFLQNWDAVILGFWRLHVHALIVVGQLLQRRFVKQRWKNVGAGPDYTLGPY